MRHICTYCFLNLEDNRETIHLSQFLFGISNPNIPLNQIKKAFFKFNSSGGDHSYCLDELNVEWKHLVYSQRCNS